MFKTRMIRAVIVAALSTVLSFSADVTTEPVVQAAVVDTEIDIFGQSEAIKHGIKTKIEQKIEEKKRQEEEERLRREEEERIAAEQVRQAEQQYTEPTYSQPTSNGTGLTRSGGVNYHNGWKETYYSSNVAYHYRTGEWTADENGVYRDAEGYVIVASSSDAQGAVVDTSFGAGKVYDTGCAEGTHDIYTNW